MKSWVLVLVINWGYSPQAVVINFDDLTKCEVAGKELVIKNSDANYTCVYGGVS